MCVEVQPAKKRADENSETNSAVFQGEGKGMPHCFVEAIGRKENVGWCVEGRGGTSPRVTIKR